MCVGGGGAAKSSCDYFIIQYLYLKTETYFLRNIAVTDCDAILLCEEKKRNKKTSIEGGWFNLVPPLFSDSCHQRGKYPIHLKHDRLQQPHVTEAAYALTTVRLRAAPANTAPHTRLTPGSQPWESASTHSTIYCSTVVIN